MNAQKLTYMKDDKNLINEEENIYEDEFFSLKDILPKDLEAMDMKLKNILSELDELFREKRWEDILTLIYPLEEKHPELIHAGLDPKLRSKSAFALGQLNRFEEAIKELMICVNNNPDNFHYHSSLAYTAYNALYRGQRKEIFLRGNNKVRYIELAHKHFKKAQELRPDGITNFYRQGMLFKQIERKPKKAIPLFKKAVKNWESLDKSTKEKRHQEMKNYIKSLYQLAGSLLETGNTRDALVFLNHCIENDKSTNYIEPVYKFFTLGKIYYSIRDCDKTIQALDTALKLKKSDNVDFIYELMARTYLTMGNYKKAFEVISTIPEQKRRPYYRWTEADILCKLKALKAARKVLLKSINRDNRSRHKGLIRLAKVEYLSRNFIKSRQYARDAGRFFSEKWGGILDDALYWEALNSFRLNDHDRAMSLLNELKNLNPYYKKITLLEKRLNNINDGDNND